MEDLMEIDDIQESKTFHQLGIFCLDGSGSMSKEGEGNLPLADQVNLAVREFLSYFKGSSLAENFSLAFITFDHQAKIHTDITPLKDIDDFGDYNPQNNGHGGGTNIGNALKIAEELAEKHLSNPDAENLPHDVKIIVMSDGLCQAAEQSIKKANALKENEKITIFSTHFRIRKEKDDGTKDFLIKIANSVNEYKTTYSEEDLRKFFIASMSAKKKIDRMD